jgi:predicted nucleic acid-binding protein
VIIVDTSAVLAALVGRPRSTPLGERLVDEELHAPHLLDVEFLHALRRLVATRSLALTRAEDARDDLLDLSIVRYPHHPLSDRIWNLRGALTAYDATFVALAEALDAPLVTCDAKLGRSKGHDARVEVFAAG